jgi:hypothetical protein
VKYSSGDDWCVHYAGLSEFSDHGLVDVTRCRAGVAYDDVEAATPAGPRWKRLPCFRDQEDIATCAQRRFPTDEEIEARNTERRARVLAYFENIANNECPHCHQAVKKYQQVGRCVYADPCGHRMYQGRVPKPKAATP